MEIFLTYILYHCFEHIDAFKETRRKRLQCIAGLEKDKECGLTKRHNKSLYVINIVSGDFDLINAWRVQNPEL